MAVCGGLLQIIRVHKLSLAGIEYKESQSYTSTRGYFLMSNHILRTGLKIM